MSFWSYDNPSQKTGGQLIGFTNKSGSPLKVDLKILAERIKAREGIK